MSKGVLTVVSGFSGAGKGTVMKRLLEKYENYALSISVTTRKPREGERDGIEYFFRTREEVEAMIQEDQLLEHAEYVGYKYQNCFRNFFFDLHCTLNFYFKDYVFPLRKQIFYIKPRSSVIIMITF